MQGGAQQMKKSGGICNWMRWLPKMHRFLRLTIEHKKTLKKPVMRSSTGDGKHLDSGVDACFCWLCKKWLLRNVSTCHTHIIRHWGTHEGWYLAGCQRERVEPNERIMSTVMKAGKGAETQKQESLEKWTVDKVPLWSKVGLMEYIIELVVVDDQAISLVDRAAFHRLLLFQHPTLMDHDIPHCSSVVKAIHDKAHKVRETVKELFAPVTPTLESLSTGCIALRKPPRNGLFAH
ncbi:hypothetical protein EI94DRAFT_1710730 [Lactarius quietus]|nr:hypothetical protein EI94DRAFT_1710730 [Lactarius quietus]